MDIYVILRWCLRLKHGATKLTEESIQGCLGTELVPSTNVKYGG